MNSAENNENNETPTEEKPKSTILNKVQEVANSANLKIESIYEFCDNFYLKVSPIYIYLLGTVLSGLISYLLHYNMFGNQEEIETQWKFAFLLTCVFFTSIFYMTDDFLVSLVISIVSSFDIKLSHPTSLAQWPMNLVSIVCITFISKLTKNSNPFVLIVLLIMPISYFILNRSLEGYSYLLPFGYAGMMLCRYLFRHILEINCKYFMKGFMTLFAYLLILLATNLFIFIAQTGQSPESASPGNLSIELGTRNKGLIIGMLISFVISGIYIRNSFLWLIIVCAYVSRDYDGDNLAFNTINEIEIALFFAVAKSISRIKINWLAKIFALSVLFYFSIYSFWDPEAFRF